jgi:hypothetical protein
LFGESLGNADAESLLTAMIACGDDGMSATDISRHFDGHKGAKELAHLVAILASQGRAEKRPVKGASGRTKDRWYAVENTANSENSGNSENRRDGDDPPPAQNSLISLNSPFAIPSLCPNCHMRPADDALGLCGICAAQVA